MVLAGICQSSYALVYAYGGDNLTIKRIKNISSHGYRIRGDLQLEAVTVFGTMCFYSFYDFYSASARGLTS